MARAITLLWLIAAVSLVASAAPGWDASLPRHSAIVAGYTDIDAVKRSIDTSPLRHIEGLWQFGSDQATVAIRLCDDPAVALPGTEIYQIVIVDSPRPSIAPGTVLGYAVPSGRPNTYDARMYTSSVRSLLQNFANFTLTLNPDDTHISITPDKRRWRLLLRHTFHFLMRVGLYADPASERDIDGMTRLYPQSTGRPAQPVYL